MDEIHIHDAKVFEERAILFFSNNKSRKVYAIYFIPIEITSYSRVFPIATIATKMSRRIIEIGLF